MKSISDERPDVFQDLGNGSWYYNHNIEEKQVEDPQTGEMKTVYEYDSTLVWNTPTYESVVKACIREELDETQEFALVNAYNAYKLGLGQKSDEDDYKDYLRHVAAIKAQVRFDFDNN